MAELIAMPKLSDTMEEGVVAKWVIKVGDKVSEGDLLCEVETDKATMDYESPADGVLLAILTEEGKKVKVGEAICSIGQAGEKAEAPSKKTTTKSSEKKESSQPSSKEIALPPVPASKSVDASGKEGLIKASPLARKVAADKGINLASLQGSGPHGRVIMRDLDGKQTAISTTTANFAQPSLTPSRQDRSIPVSMMRQTIAKRLVSGKNEAPHFYLTRTVDVDSLLSLRATLNDASAEKKGFKISVNDLILLACSRALRQHPEVNSSWQGETILERGSVDLAMAVALPGGLITPVIRNCDQLGLWAIAGVSRDLAAKAKANQLKPEDYTGGSFTVSNLGMFGIDHFTAIINPPQAGILAVGASRQEFVPDSAGLPKLVTRMTLTLSCDHRVVDGALGAQFLKTLAGF